MSDDQDAEWLARRAELVEAVGRGLFTGKEVMAELGISAGTWGGWCRAEQVRQAKARGAAAGSGPGAFARVALVGSSRARAGFVVAVRGGRRLRVGEGFDAAELVRIVKALESC